MAVEVALLVVLAVAFLLVVAVAFSRPTGVQSSPDAPTQEPMTEAEAVAYLTPDQPE